ncbi:hypothetical protein FHX57_006350 [Paraburkholderia tropica]|uniref:hypothetical protein n=1 Tax=Paraburkholderia tropica TaxID=92647 RepID=UPI0016095A83|nr:hypothetical protein [Paraburkholderia tropica]MBB3003971.1 hypothetical protein [Paraburkholderia tropica]
MNVLRRFLLRGGKASQALFLFAFAVLLSRALLPGAVMLDPVSVAQGDFALVMCSGHGPMFAPDQSTSARMSNSMPGMDMGHMAGMVHDGMDMSGPGSASHDSMSGDDGLCPFSAALVVACVATAIIFALFTLTRFTQSWSAVSLRALVRLIPHCRPLCRAPPHFS